MTDFAWAEFGISILETSIGAGLGFGLGLVAFHYQHKREKEAENTAAIDEALDAINRLSQSAGLNIEALANLKIQILKSAAIEMQQMSRYVGRYHDDPSGRRSLFPEIKTASEALTFFYQTMPSVMVMPAPDYKEYALLVPDMPALTTYAHRAMGITAEINELIKERNAMVAEHAKAGTSDGLTEGQYVYYWSMLSDMGVNIIQLADDALVLFNMILAQNNYFFRAKYPQKKQLSISIAPMAKAEIPSDNPFHELQQQMAKFEGRSA